ncbi:MAG: hypothetical protein NVSMB70_00770 [Chamaesiphon sp.]
MVLEVNIFQIEREEYMSQAITKIINFQDLLLGATQETLGMMSQGIDISDPSVITPLEWTANQYPEIAQACNESLIELVTEQMHSTPHQESNEMINKF